MTASRFIWALPISATIIISLCIWRMMNPRADNYSTDLPDLKQPAPAFQLYDQESTLVNLESFLHRHTIVLVFFNGKAGPEADAMLTQLRTFYPALKKEGVVVLAVSTALPQENRNNSTSEFPFPLLTDAVAASQNSVHRTWDRLIEPLTLDQPAGTRPAVFVIDRSGLVSWKGLYPVPDAKPEQVVSRLLSGS